MPELLNSAKASVDSGWPPVTRFSSNMSYVHSSTRDRAEITCDGMDGGSEAVGMTGYRKKGLTADGILEEQGEDETKV